MKTVILAAACVIAASPAHAQLAAIEKGLKRAQQQVRQIQISESEEQQIGAEVSEKLRARFGVVQDRAVHTYVTSVGMLLALESGRPNLPWTFVVLDTDGVNAFASPGGFVHVTRGALALARNEAELAGVLGHEITHIAEKHTVNAIQKNKAVQMAATEAGGSKAELIRTLTGKAYEMVIENSFDRGDEAEADQEAVALASRVGYAPAGLADFLAALADRNRGQQERNGLFASHPETRERIDRIRTHAASLKGGTALVASRYRDHIRYEAKALAEVPQAAEGSAGLAGGTKAPKPEEQKPAEAPPKKKGFSLESLKKTVSSDSQSAQVSASGGARGVGPDRNAKGGPNPSLVAVSVSAAELAAFRRGIA